MRIRIICIIISVLLLSGCPPKKAMLKQRNLQHIDVGLGVDGTSKIIESNSKVDLLASEVVKLMKGHGFELVHTGVSWGLQPLTGHTQGMSFSITGVETIYCYIQISKKEFQVKFSELESKPQSNEFSTTEKHREIIDKAIVALSDLAKSTFHGRSIRVSKFNRGTKP